MDIQSNLSSVCILDGEGRLYQIERQAFENVNYESELVERVFFEEEKRVLNQRIESFSLGKKHLLCLDKNGKLWGKGV